MQSIKTDDGIRPENIDQLLDSRHMSKKIRQAGGRLKGPKKRQKEDDEKFEKSFNKLCEFATNN